MQRNISPADRGGYPQLVIDIGKLQHNARVLKEKLRGAGCSMMLVTKSLCADERVVEAVCGEADYLADSRIRNLRRVTETLRRMKITAARTPSRVLLRIAQESEIADVVRYADISFQSEVKTIKRLDAAAGSEGIVHRVVLMIDMGDLREGIFYTDREKIFDAVQMVLASPNLELHGIAVNLTCYGAIIPKRGNLQEFADIGREIEERHSIKLELYSGGNSSSVYLIDRKELPEGINNLRLGEAFILGNETAYGERIEDTYDDAVTLKAQIVELYRKPSLPIGESGVDAFGKKPQYKDRGMIDRAILAVGKQDIDDDSIYPVDKGIEVLGSSSDHLIMDVSGGRYSVGDVVEFKLGYGALLRASTSAYVYRTYV